MDAESRELRERVEQLEREKRDLESRLGHMAREIILQRLEHQRVLLELQATLSGVKSPLRGPALMRVAA